MLYNPRNIVGNLASRENSVIFPLSATAWTPRSLGSKLVAWWSVAEAQGTARLLDTLGDGLIVSWTDEIAGIVLTAALLARPTYSAAGYCGTRKSLLFDGVANCLRGTTNISLLPNGATAGEVWVLAESVGAASGTDQLAQYGSVTNGLKRGIARASTERFQVSDGTTALTGGSTNSTAGVFVACGYFSGTTEGGRIRGTISSPYTATISSLNTGTTRMAIGSTNSTTAANFASAAISDVLITTALTYNERYLLESWGYRELQALSILPTDHRYKTGPDASRTFASLSAGARQIVGVSTLPFKYDFRSSTFFPPQIKTTRAAATYDYDVSGVLQTFAVNTPALTCYDPVTHEALGLQNFASNSQYGVVKSTPANQTISLTKAAGPIFSAYVLGSGSMQLAFSAPVQLVSESDVNVVTSTTSSISIPAVSASAVGYQAGAVLFNLLQDVTVTVTFAGSNSFFQIETDYTSPPMLTGQRRTSLISAPYGFLGLDPTVSLMTAVFLFRATHVHGGGTIFQLDDDLAIGVNSRRKYVWNYLANPNPPDTSKNGQMGITIDNIDDDPDPAGLDPVDVVMARNSWRCFATSLNVSTGVVRVCCNGGAVREATFDSGDFVTTGLKKLRFMLQMSGSPIPGYLGGVQFTQEFLSSVDLAALCTSGGAFTYT